MLKSHNYPLISSTSSTLSGWCLYHFLHFQPTEFPMNVFSLVNFTALTYHMGNSFTSLIAHSAQWKFHTLLHY